MKSNSHMAHVENGAVLYYIIFLFSSICARETLEIALRFFYQWISITPETSWQLKPYIQFDWVRTKENPSEIDEICEKCG